MPAACPPRASIPAARARPLLDFLDLPVAANGHVSLDDEALAFAGDGSFWIGDEYGAYVYHFTAGGKMLVVTRPPGAFIPMRGGAENFSANSPPHGQKYDVGNPQSGRQDNQGFEGMSITPDHKHLLAITQSALMQDIDPKAAKTTRRYVRVRWIMHISHLTPVLAREYTRRCRFGATQRQPIWSRPRARCWP